jgi:hypothetical protein
MAPHGFTAIKTTTSRITTTITTTSAIATEDT